jgi:DNA-binding response OmpR family regulator
LTLILGYAQFGLDANSQENSHFTKIKSAGLRLQELVNQMLDLNKAESGKMTIVPHLGDLAVFLASTCKNLESLAGKKGIMIDFQSDSQPFMAGYDKDIIQKVVENLLTNAIKFSPNDSLIAVKLRKSPVQDPASPSYEISVQDQGAGIPQQEIPSLFQPFYQMENIKSVAGTGLGLALVRELVHQCGGIVDATSFPEKGTCFTVKMPLSTRSLPVHDAFDFSLVDPSSRFNVVEDHDVIPNRRNPENAPWVLIVEDNADVRSYLTRCLQDHYRLLTAENGRIGLDLALQQVPDIIISDVMMPEMDGFAFLETIRSSSVTSHIPFIMLTARGDMEDRLKGLGKGANIYLPKPFDPRELLLSVSNLLALQERSRLRYESYTWKSRSQPEPPDYDEENVSGVQADPAEDPFFTKLVLYIETHIHSSELDNEELCRAMGMSRSQLNRKVTALTGHPPVKLVRRLRVKKAMEQLKLDREATISEIAYDCGFSSPAYFTRVFQAEVGIAPSDFREMR